MVTFRTIVVPTDFSETSREAVRIAREMAEGTQSHIHLLHVVPDIWHQPLTVDEPFVDFPALQRQWTDDARLRLRALAEDEGLEMKAVTIAAVIGTPAPGVVGYALEQRADLIVMGAQGHGPVHRFLLGSVAERVSRQARCPVMLVPHRILRDTAQVTPASEAAAAATTTASQP